MFFSGANQWHTHTQPLMDHVRIPLSRGDLVSGATREGLDVDRHYCSRHLVFLLILRSQ